MLKNLKRKISTFFTYSKGNGKIKRGGRAEALPISLVIVLYSVTWCQGSWDRIPSLADHHKDSEHVYPEKL